MSNFATEEGAKSSNIASDGQHSSFNLEVNYDRPRIRPPRRTLAGRVLRTQPPVTAHPGELSGNGGDQSAAERPVSGRSDELHRRIGPHRGDRV